MDLAVFLWVVFVVVNVADFVLTSRWLELGGQETNPALRAIMRWLKNPTAAMVATKLPALGLTYYLAASPWEYRSAFLGVCVAVYSYVVWDTYRKLEAFSRSQG